MLERPHTPAAHRTVPPLSVAPMMERTDRHYRWFMRRITRTTLLYTEMVTALAVKHGDRDHLLGFDASEHPLALQLGGDDPELLAECARIAEDRGYDEVNLNIGCPSERVQSGNFGACLMQTPEVVARCVETMRRAVSIPVTVKHRIGVDDLDRYEDMHRFVSVVAEAGCTRFSVHARKAWLKGLSPKENRNIPPLRYDDVYRLKRELPHLFVEINGGVRSLSEVDTHLEHVDAVMIGRAAYDDPWIFSTVDSRYAGVPDPADDRSEVVEAMIEYVDRWRSDDFKPHWITRHIIHLFDGLPGARVWRRVLSTRANRPGTGGEVVREAWDAMREQAARVAARKAAYEASRDAVSLGGESR